VVGATRDEGPSRKGQALSAERPGNDPWSEEALAWLRHYHLAASAVCVVITFLSQGWVVPLAGLALSLYFSILGRWHFPAECARCDEAEVVTVQGRHAHCLRAAHLYFLYPHFAWPVPAAFVVWALLERAPWSPLLIGVAAAAGVVIAGCLDVHARFQERCEDCAQPEEAW